MYIFDGAIFISYLLHEARSEVHMELIINEISSCDIPLLQLQTLVNLVSCARVSAPNFRRRCITDVHL